MYKEWYSRLRRYWEFLILPVLIAFLASLVIGEAAECANEFLKELNAATVQLLGFTGIILGVAYAAYYSSLAQMNETSKGFLELHDKLGERLELDDRELESRKRSPEWRDAMGKMQVDVAIKQAKLSSVIIAMDFTFRRSFKAFVVSASAFAILVIIGLFHLQICACLIISGFFFFCECFLLVFGIEILLFGLYNLVGASEVRARPT